MNLSGLDISQYGLAEVSDILQIIFGSSRGTGGRGGGGGMGTPSRK